MKKTDHLRLNFLLTGFSISCLLVLGAFRITSYVSVNNDVIYYTADNEDYIPIYSHIIEIPKADEHVAEKTKIMKIDFPTTTFTIVRNNVVLRSHKINVPALPQKPIQTLPVLPKPVDDKVYTYYEKKASFPGGEEELKRFIERNIRFPELAKESGREGIVRVRFVVEKDGSISNIEVIKDEIGYGADHESIRVISSMPRWTPATINGRYVRTMHIQPIIFQIY